MKYYFYTDEEEQPCYDKQHFIDEMKRFGINEMEVFEAITCRETNIFYCEFSQEWGDKGEDTCGKRCNHYEPRNGIKGCCKFYSNIGYEAGKKVTLRLK